MSSTPSFDVDSLKSLAKKADRSAFDLAFFGASTGGVGLFRSGMSDAYEVDALPLASALAPITDRVGLGAVVPLGETHPFHTARAFSVLDHLSAGRAAWVIPPRHEDEGTDGDGRGSQALGADEWYRRAAEYIAVVRKLWDSWEDGSVIADKSSGLFADSRRVHPIDHVGEYFSVHGPLTAVRPLQGHPLIVQYDGSDRGLRLAAETADVFVSTCATPAEAVHLRGTLSSLLDAHRRPREALRFLIGVSPVLGETDADAVRQSRQLEEMSASFPGGRLKERWGLPFVGTASQLRHEMTEKVKAGLCDGFNIMPAVLPGGIDLLLGEMTPKSGDDPSAALRKRFDLDRPRGAFRAGPVPSV